MCQLGAGLPLTGCVAVVPPGWGVAEWFGWLAPGWLDGFGDPDGTGSLVTPWLGAVCVSPGVGFGAEVSAGVGFGADADVCAGVGVGFGVDADVSAGVGVGFGADADVSAGVGVG